MCRFTRVGIVYVGNKSGEKGIQSTPMFEPGCSCGWTGGRDRRAKAQAEAYDHFKTEEPPRLFERSGT